MKKFTVFLILCLGLCLGYLNYIDADTGISITPGVTGLVGTNDIKPGAVTEDKLSNAVQGKLNTVAGGGSGGGVAGSGSTGYLAEWTGTDTLSYSTHNDTDIAEGVTAYGWGNHGVAGYFLASNVDTDSTFAANSDSKVASQKAVKTALAGKQATLTNPVTGTGTTNKMAKFTASGVVGDGTLTDTQVRTRHFQFAIIDPSNLTDTTICITSKLGNAITVTNIEVCGDVHVDTEITGDLMYADTDFYTLGTPTLVSAFDTTSSKSSTAVANVVIAIGKVVYIKFDANISSSYKEVVFDITYLLN